MSGPCEKARIVPGGILVPTSGVVQSAMVLPLVTEALAMRNVIAEIEALTRPDSEYACGRIEPALRRAVASLGAVLDRVDHKSAFAVPGDPK